MHFIFIFSKSLHKYQISIMASASLFSLLTIVSLISIAILLTPLEANNTNGYGFSIDIVHRDSPKSPFYDPSETRSQRLRKAIRRSFNRVHRFSNDPTSSSSSSPNTASAEIVSANGEYLMNVSVGTPPFQVLAIADTGSDLIWTQCKPCTHCYKQQEPLFDPKASSTYKEISCSSDTCLTSGGGSCDKVSNSCQYSVSYGDQSYSNGVIAVETLTLGSTAARPISIPKTVFGCGIDNDGTFNGEGSGIIGLGGGSASLISQLGSTIGGKFSYCLIPLSQTSSSTPSSSSKMNFGSKGVVSGEGVVSTGLVQKSPQTFYFLTLQAISVGAERINFYQSQQRLDSSSDGNIIIDSGTTLTLLPREFYEGVEAAVIRQVKSPRVEDPGQVLSLCYHTQTDIDSLPMTAHFTGGDLKLNSYNIFVRLSESIVCFAFAPVDSLAIFGNVAQANFLVGYDVAKRTVSFKPADCSTQQ